MSGNKADQPLFVYDRPPPMFEVTSIARMISGPGLSVSTAESRIHRFKQARWIFPVGRRGAANLYGPTEAAAAAVLSVLTDVGIEDHVMMGLASTPLYGWQHDQLKGRALHPILEALMRAGQGEWWAYQFRLLCHDQTGERYARAWVYDPETFTPPPQPPASGMVPRATITIHLLPILLPVYRRVMASLDVSESVGTH